MVDNLQIRRLHRGVFQALKQRDNSLIVVCQVYLVLLSLRLPEFLDQELFDDKSDILFRLLSFNQLLEREEANELEAGALRVHLLHQLLLLDEDLQVFLVVNIHVL